MKTKRELKFRAWNIPNKTMYMDIQKGVLCENEKGQLILGTSFETICKDAGSIIMQYAEITDKNFVPIYEKDIVKGISFKEPFAKKTKIEVIGTVEYDPTKGFYFNGDLNGGRTYPPLTSCEVIGNVYQNYDLLQ